MIVMISQNENCDRMNKKLSYKNKENISHKRKTKTFWHMQTANKDYIWRGYWKGMIRKQKQVKQWISRSQISHKYQILPRKYDQEWWLVCLTRFAFINFDIINCQFVHQNKCPYSNSIKMYDGKRSVGIWTNKQKNPGTTCRKIFRLGPPIFVWLESICSTIYLTKIYKYL